jgi:hypothetical protein
MRRANELKLGRKSLYVQEASRSFQTSSSAGGGRDAAQGVDPGQAQMLYVDPSAIPQRLGTQHLKWLPNSYIHPSSISVSVRYPLSLMVLCQSLSCWRTLRTAPVHG